MKTINHLMAGSCTRYAGRPVLSMAFGQPLSYADLALRVKQAALSLLEEGIKKGEPVAILAENSPDWGVVYLAIVRIGAVAVPILPDFPENDVHHILQDAGVTLLFCSTRQIEKVAELARGGLKKIILLDVGSSVGAPVVTVPFADFMSAGEHSSARQGEKLAMLAGSVRETDPASIIYTSGTSGHSKAVLLTHSNLVSNVDSARIAVNVLPDWTFLSILPLSHTYEFTIGFLLALASGARIVYAGARPTPTVLQKICAHEKPTVACVVPMVMEKIYKKRVQPALEQKKLMRLALRLPVLRRHIYRKIGRKLVDFFGGKLELLAIGGAPLNQEVEAFLAEAGFPYIIGYGLTEASPLVSGGPHLDPSIAVGSAGKPVSGVQVKIINPDPATGIGEILVKGPNVMQGYVKNPKATAEAVNQDGWLVTGDLGYFDGYGNLFIKGRIKSVIVPSHGENIYPEAIEDKFNSFLHVAESLVVQRNDRVEAWLYFDNDSIDLETGGQSQQQKLEYKEKLMASMRQAVNAGLPQYAQVVRCVERQEPFIKTATHKIKRYLYNE